MMLQFAKMIVQFYSIMSVRATGILALNGESLLNYFVFILFQKPGAPSQNGLKIPLLQRYDRAH